MSGNSDGGSRRWPVFAGTCGCLSLVLGLGLGGGGYLAYQQGWISGGTPTADPPTSEITEPVTTEPVTTEPVTTEPVTTDPVTSGTTVTEDDLDGAKEIVASFYKAIVAGDYTEACGYVLAMGPDDSLHEICVDSMETAGEDLDPALEGNADIITADLFTADIEDDETIVVYVVGDTESPTYVVKGDDGELVINLLKTPTS
jgi:hypothetical protein